MSTPRRRAVEPEDRVRQPTEVRRRLVVEAALDLIRERGLVGVGLRDVATAAGVSVGTLTYHFAGLQEVLSAAITLEIESYHAPLTATALAEPRAIDGWWRICDALFTADTDRHWRLWFDYFTVGMRGEVFAQRQEERYEHWQRDLVALLTRAVDEGDATCEDVDRCVTRFIALVDGLALQRLRRVPELDAEAARAHLHDFCRLELGVTSARTAAPAGTRDTRTTTGS
jgi:AcrR family transcriptional regulator